MKQVPAIFLQAVIVLTGIATFAFLLREPHTEGVNAHATFFEVYLDPFIALVYTGSVPFFAALYQAFRLLGYVCKNNTFSPAALKTLRIIRYCAIAIICFVAAEEFIIMLNHGNDDPAGAVFIGFLVTFGSLIAAAFSIILEQILQKGLDTKAMASNQV